MDAAGGTETASCRRASCGSPTRSSRRRPRAARSTGSAPAPSSRSARASERCEALGGAVVGATRTIREIVGDSRGQLDQLNRLGRVGAGTRISFGLLLDEQAERAPDDVVLLFEDRAHTHAAVKERVDNVVRGLLEIGVRQGEHVGVLMQTRPSALTVVAALSRLGAVAVLMRPDGDPGREAELGKARADHRRPAERGGGRGGERPAGLRARRRRRGAPARRRA